MEENKELVVADQKPADVIIFGKNAAEVLKDVVKQANLIKNINGQDYMMFEGWQTVGKFFKTNAGIEWTKQVTEEGKIVGFEARAYVKNEEGNIISTSESYCGRDEPNWRARPLFAIRSMAQTRACAKALRQVYSWVVVLAGYKPTPVEEMDGFEKDTEIKKPHPVPLVPEDPTCNQCKKKISEKVYKYSVERNGEPLCYNCQKGGKVEEAEYTEEPVM